MSQALAGSLAGLAASGCMTVWETLFFRRHGLEACLDWEVNQHLISRLNGRAPEANLVESLAMHFIVGIGVGVGFGLFAFNYPTPALVWVALALGVALWLLLLPMRRLVTGLAPRGKPVVVSLVGHAIYGMALAAAVICLRGQ